MTTNRFDEIAFNISSIRERIAIAAEKSGRNPKEIQLMAVTKGRPASDVDAAIKSGITLIGENRAQEFLKRQPEYNLSKNQIHFIGHLQKNKVRCIIEKVGMIQSIDSYELAQVVEREAEKANLSMPVLLQVNIGKEETKSGFLPEEVSNGFKQVASLPHLSLQGLMCIPPKERSDYYFKKMFSLFVDISQKKVDNSIMRYLSMGMSGDFEKAIQNGSNLIRLGRAVFEV